MARSQAVINEVRDPYSIKSDSGEIVNTKTASPRKTIKIHGHTIRVKDIPITAANLSCGHNIRGIAFAVGDIVHCDNHGEQNTIPANVVEVFN
jgi:hypothetical protein